MVIVNERWMRYGDYNKSALVQHITDYYLCRNIAIPRIVCVEEQILEST